MKNHKLNIYHPKIKLNLPTYKILESFGFTLVELLVVFTIISIIFALGYANYRNYSQRQAQIAIARQIVSDLELAKNSASAGVKPPGCIGQLNGYKYTQAAGVFDSYSIIAECENDVTVISRNSILDDNIFWILPSLTPFKFKTIASGTDIPLSMAELTIRVYRISDQKTVTISVSYSGEINISE